MRHVAFGALIFVGTLLALGWGAAAQVAPESPVVVRPGESIQAAIDRAPTGAVIGVHPLWKI